MTTRFILALAGLAGVVMCMTATAAARRPATQWTYFHFDGRTFIPGQPTDGTPFVAVRDGIRPVVLTQSAKIQEVKLPPDNGAVVGICYVQVSGGKLKSGPAYLPFPRLPVQISAGGKVVASLETDQNGYFLVTLPVGMYRISARETIEVKVANGITTLTPLRVGKRMVD